MPRGVYARKNNSINPVVDSKEEPVLAPVDAVIETPAAEEAKGIEEEKPEAFTALKKAGFYAPAHVWKNRLTKKAAVKWGLKHFNGAAEVFEGNKFVRVYRKDTHGEDYLKLAEGLIKKKNSLLE